MKKYIFDIKKDEEETNKLKIQLKNGEKELKKQKFLHYFYLIPKEIRKSKKRIRKT